MFALALQSWADPQLGELAPPEVSEPLLPLLQAVRARTTAQSRAGIFFIDVSSIGFSEA
jgi:hypothetical protein